MKELASFFFGGLVGAGIFYAVSTFTARLSFAVWNDYCQLFTPQETAMPQTTLTKKKCGHFWHYFFAIGGLFALCVQLNANIWVALWWACWLSALIFIGLIDGLYRLISPLLCVWLFLWGLLGAYWQILPFGLEQCVISAVSIFVIFYGLYVLCRWGLKKEMLGEGDCWLVLALGAEIQLEKLPHFVFLASLYGIVFYLIKQRLVKKSHHNATPEIPFAPFLILSALTLVWW
ncbi:prepilin peptidase [Avibacterium paragallinarum]|uniref:prepilin peptidase n=1 Tax=Avibacterium paragallinarum TaxID=728 RepID=UPI0021F7E456|nr:A24 family peptidase [Avibacterium paragallinarum]UXN35386.1 A24 family peptidase [Avibacterium paragallinarum]